MWGRDSKLRTSWAAVCTKPSKYLSHHTLRIQCKELECVQTLYQQRPFITQGSSHHSYMKKQLHWVNLRTSIHPALPPADKQPNGDDHHHWDEQEGANDSRGHSPGTLFGYGLDLLLILLMGLLLLGFGGWRWLRGMVVFLGEDLWGLLLTGHCHMKGHRVYRLQVGLDEGLRFYREVYLWCGW